MEVNPNGEFGFATIGLVDQQYRLCNLSVVTRVPLAPKPRRQLDENE